MDIKTVWVESVDILVDILGIIQYILKIPECVGFIFFHFGGREGSTRY